MQKEVIGYGSFIEGTYGKKLPQAPTPNFGETILFYAGRYALKYLIKRIMASKPITSIWLPQYYCPFVKKWMHHEFDMIHYYEVDPFDPNAKIDWCPFSQNDVVLVNNYWGLKDTDIPNGDRPVIIEDHSHGWLSEGSLNSKADFCFASLRKTLPIPMGGIAWKPNASTLELPIYNEDLFDTYTGSNPMNDAWNTILGAMELKATCQNTLDKQLYLDQYMKGELMVRSIYNMYPVSKAHVAFINQHIYTDFNSFKKKYVDYALPKLTKNNQFKVINHKNKVPFGLLLAFKEEEALNDLKRYLISKQIYPALLWPMNNLTTEYTHLLNVHMDFRLTKKDVDYIVMSINNWTFQTN